MENKFSFCHGSISIFLSLSMILIFSFLFSLLEAARYHVLWNQSKQNAMLSMYSLMGEYNSFLWENYHFLLLDGNEQNGEFKISQIENRIMQNSRDSANHASQISKNVDFYRNKLVNIQIDKYQLAPDFDGSGMIRQISNFYKKEAIAGAINSLLDLENTGKQLEDEKKQLEEQKQEADAALKQLEEQKQEADAALKHPEEQKQEANTAPKQLEKQKQEVENPIDIVTKLKQKSFLQVFLPDRFQISEQTVVQSEICSKRILEKGSWIEKQEISKLERVIFQLYLKEYFSSAIVKDMQGSHRLKYELEYLIAGHNNDRDNLEAVIKQLVLIRETGNFLTLMKDPQKKSAALMIATATVGATGLVPLIKAVQIGILLAWAFIESVLDIKVLLSGEKIPLIKEIEEWKSDLSNPENSLNIKEDDTKNRNGLSYEDYLQILLLTKRNKQLAYRCLDIVEQNARLGQDNERFYIDHMILAMDANFTFEAKELFWSLILTRKEKLNKYTMNIQNQTDYF